MNQEDYDKGWIDAMKHMEKQIKKGVKASIKEIKFRQRTGWKWKK